MRTVHAPHCPSPQPYFVPVRSRRLRRTARSASSAGASTLSGFPLTLRETEGIPWSILLIPAPEERSDEGPLSAPPHESTSRTAPEGVPRFARDDRAATDPRSSVIPR